MSLKNDKAVKVEVVFAQPFAVDAELASRLEGRVAVLDIGFNNGKPGCENPEAEYAETTGAFIDALGDRLVVWMDHHPHKEWSRVADDPRFVLKDRGEAPACPMLISEGNWLFHPCYGCGHADMELCELPCLTDQSVPRRPADTIVAHGDFDGIMSAAKFALGGVEPYDGADADAVAADSRVGQLSPKGQRLESALKADLRNDEMRRKIFAELVTGEHDPDIDAAAAKYAAVMAETERLMGLYEPLGEKVVYIDAEALAEGPFDLTQLTLAGQKDGKVAIARNLNFKGETQLTITGNRDWDFVSLFGLPGGMPNRVNIAVDRLEEAVEKINSRART
jgi:hypothetical protein